MTRYRIRKSGRLWQLYHSHGSNGGWHGPVMESSYWQNVAWVATRDPTPSSAGLYSLADLLSEVTTDRVTAMASANPVSPKVVWAGVGSILGPLLLTIGQAFVDIFTSGSVQFPPPWDQAAVIVASLLGAVIAAYAKKDPLRLPTIDEEAVKDLDTSG